MAFADVLASGMAAVARSGAAAVSAGAACDEAAAEAFASLVAVEGAVSELTTGADLDAEEPKGHSEYARLCCPKHVADNLLLDPTCSDVLRRLLVLLLVVVLVEAKR